MELYLITWGAPQLLGFLEQWDCIAVGNPDHLVLVSTDGNRACHVSPGAIPVHWTLGLRPVECSTYNMHNHRVVEFAIGTGLYIYSLDDLATESVVVSQAGPRSRRAIAIHMRIIQLHMDYSWYLGWTTVQFLLYCDSKW